MRCCSSRAGMSQTTPTMRIVVTRTAVTVWLTPRLVRCPRARGCVVHTQALSTDVGCAFESYLYDKTSCDDSVLYRLAAWLAAALADVKIIT